MSDKIIELLVDALKQALAVPGDHRLYRAGKLEGLFAARTGASGEAASKALAEGFLETVRTQTRAKSTIEWVRATHRATDFLYRHESPVQALKDLQGVLQASKEGVPLWLTEMRHRLQMLGDKLEEEASRWTHCLQALGEQVKMALERAEETPVQFSNGVLADVPWAPDALAYLGRRRTSAGDSPCPLPELFAALREHHADLSITSYHDRLRRLQDRRLIRLLAFEGPASDLCQPEYALVEGAQLLYYVSR
jgi:hypothetical protein